MGTAGWARLKAVRRSGTKPEFNSGTKAEKAGRAPIPSRPVRIRITVIFRLQKSSSGIRKLAEFCIRPRSAIIVLRRPKPFSKAGATNYEDWRTRFEEAVPMWASHVYLWPLALTVSGTVLISGLRYLMLFIGFRMTLAKAHKADYVLIYHEFARALRYEGGVARVIARRRRCGDGQGDDG
jgi:hypothetical protein